MSDRRSGRGWEAVRQQAFNYYGTQCMACGTGGSEANPLQVDHRHPISKGGTDDLDNLQILCRDCNIKKSNKLEVRMNWVNKKWLDSIK